MTESWGVLPLKEIPSIETQTIWHAAALTRESFGYDNVLFVDWPDKPFVSVGYHQDPNEEIEIEYCKTKGYEHYRRACGGGQVFLDGDQIFYHMITDPENNQLRGSLKNFYSKLLAPVIQTYNDFGVPAKYAPINDIVANDKKISGNGAATLGNSRILTGNFILSFPSLEMSKVLRVPNEKFRDKVAQSLEERVGSFESIRGSKPNPDELVSKFIRNFENQMDIKLVEVQLPVETKNKMEELKKRYVTNEWRYEIGSKSTQLRAVKIKTNMFVSESMIKTQGGLLKTILVSEDDKISDITLYGDISVDPMDGLDQLAKQIIGTDIYSNGLEGTITNYFNTIEIPGVEPKEIVSLIQNAAKSHKEAAH